MALLQADEIQVRFGGLQALSSASVRVDAGGITGLIGPNGAGKTTLFNVITGLQTHQGGRVMLDGEDISELSVHHRARRGIGRTFQKLEAFNSLSARDNVLVAAEMSQKWSHDRRKPSVVADEALERVGLTDVADVTAGTLPTGTARLVEMARALATRPKVLLLDEASSGLDDEETKAIGSLLQRLVADGLGVLLVEHDMAFVMGICMQIHVLDFGHIIAEGTPHDVQRDPLVQAAYLGVAKDAA